MQTENPKVAALFIAWEIAQRAVHGVTLGSEPKNKADTITKTFLTTYKAIAEAAQIDQAEASPKTVKSN